MTWIILAPVPYLRKLSLALAVAALLAAACSPTDGASDGEPSAESSTTLPATSSTVATTTTAPFVSAFPDVAVEFRQLDSSESPHPHRTVADLVADAASDAPARITFGANLAFGPPRLEVVIPSQVEFANESDRDIEIDFDWDELEPLLLGPDQSATIDLTSEAPEAIRYSTVVGSARLVGAIFIGSEPEGPGSAEPGDSIAPSADIATDLTGSIQIDLPAAGAWQVVAGYRSITFTPETPVLPLGSTGWLLSSGEPPLEETLRVDASDGFDKATADATVAGFMAPAACSETDATGPTGGRTWACGDFELLIYSIEMGEAWAVVTVARMSGSNQFDAALESIDSADAGTFAALTEIHPALFQGRPRTANSTASEPEVIDIASGSFGSPATLYALLVGTSPAIEIRNFLEETISLRANGLPFVELAPGAAVTFSVDDFESNRIGLSFGRNPITRVDLPIDATLRNPLPAIPMTASGLAPQLGRTTEPLEAVHPFFDALVTDELYPQTWVQLEESEAWFWNQPGWVVYARQLDESDPAVLARGFVSGSVASLIQATNLHVRSLPTEERRNDEAGLIRWVVAGRPTISMFYTGDVVSRSGASYRLIVYLQSSPDDHEALIEQLFEPYIRGFDVIEVGE